MAEAKPAKPYERKKWCPLKAVSCPGYPQNEADFEAWQERNSEQRNRIAAEGRWSRQGVPSGFAGKKQVVQAIRAKANVEAKKIVEHLKMTNQVELPADDPRATEALEYAVGVVRAGVDGTRERLAAARLLLDFLKAKPASKSEVTVARAEDFLTELAGKV